MAKLLSDDELLSLIKSLPSGSLADDLPLEENEPPKDNEAVDGWLMVKQNRIVVQYGQSYRDGDLTVAAESPLQLMVNGVSRESPASLKRNDRVSWRLKEASLFEIRITDDRMQAFLYVRRKCQYGVRLHETEPVTELKLDWSEATDEVLSTLTSSDIMLRIREMSICHNVNYLNIVNEVDAPTGKPVLIAQGKEPEPARDAELQLFFHERVESRLDGDAPSVNFKEHMRIPQVQTGDRIARKLDAVPGKPGFDVFGEVMLPSPPKELTVRLADNVRMLPDGNIYALTSGRPKMSGVSVKTLEISKQFVVAGDVDIGTGHIVFSGDVLIYGNVLEGMLVESLGNVYVAGSVYQAHITATGSIHVMGNIVNSALYSGYFGVVFNRMYSLTRSLIPLVTGVYETVYYMRKVLEEKGKEAPDETLVVLLVQSKFSGLPQTVRDIMQVFAEMGDKPLPDGWTDYKRHLAGWARFPLERNCLTMEAVHALLEAGKAVCSSVEQMQEHGGMIEIKQCHGSTIKSNGDIRINQEGAVQSRLFAKDRILFLHDEAVCRGGELEAGSSVQLQSVGGRIGAETVIRAQRRITARRMDLVKVILGPWEEHIDQPLGNVTIFSEKGRMRITGVRLNRT